MVCIVDYEARKPIDPFKKQIPWKWIILAAIFALLIILLFRGEGEKKEEPRGVAQEPVNETPAIAAPEPIPVAPAAEMPMETEEEVTPPDFEDVDVELEEVI
ncbi:hypothetical protein HYS48_00530 [Candidatus Woesearchaeota archaeon]|nr:hypothetical protein [Candidatus Woesearchaeota archaeon]